MFSPNSEGEEWTLPYKVEREAGSRRLRIVAPEGRIATFDRLSVADFIAGLLNEYSKRQFTLERENAALRVRNERLERMGNKNAWVKMVDEAEAAESRAKAAEEERDRLRALVAEAKRWVRYAQQMEHSVHSANKADDWLSRAEQEVKHG